MRLQSRAVPARIIRKAPKACLTVGRGDILIAPGVNPVHKKNDSQNPVGLPAGRQG